MRPTCWGACALLSLALSCSPFGGEGGGADDSRPAADAGSDGPSQIQGQPPGSLGITIKSPVNLVRGRRTKVAFDVARNDGFVGKVTVSLRGAPQGTTTEPTTLKAEVSSGELAVTIPATIPPGPLQGLSVEAVDETGGVRASTAVPATVAVAPGEVDSTFAGAGSLDLTSPVHAIALAPNDQLYIASNEGAGRFSLKRYTAAGSIDATFGSGGSVDVAIGGLRVAGLSYSGQQLYYLVDGYVGPGGLQQLARLASDGTLDGTFGTNGIYSFGSLRSYGLAVSASGRIAAFGTDVAIPPNARIRWITSQGAADESVNASSSSYTDVAGQASDGVYTPDTLFVVGGSYAFWLNPAGGGFRYEPLSLGTNLELRRAKMDSVGRFLVAGVDATSSHLFVARVRATGQLDKVFADVPVSVDPPPSISAAGVGLALQEDGKVLVAAKTSAGCVIVRFDAEGAIDSDFGTNGASTVALIGCEPRSLHVQKTKRLVLDGTKAVVGIVL